MGERIFLTQHACDLWWPAIERLAPGSLPVVFGSRHGGAGSRPLAPSADIAWVTFDVWSGSDGGEGFFAELASLDGVRWCHTSASGVDAPAYSALVGRGAALTRSQVNAGPVADFVLRAVLDEFQRPEEWRAAAARRSWSPHGFREMAESEWLVVGLGAIGRGVASRALSFGARVVGCRRSPDGGEPCDRVVRPARLLEAVPSADVVVLSAPATAETRALVDATFLGQMKTGSVLVNVARGSLVDTAALLAGLDAGTPGVAILDTFDVEPLPVADPLWTHPRVVVTPHNAARGLGNERRAAAAFLENLDRWLRGSPLAGRADGHEPAG